MRVLFAVVLAGFVPASLIGQSGTRPVWPDEGPRTWAPRPTAPEITANDLRTRLYQFADDSMMGRRIGEPGNLKGTDYIAREFVRLGLTPGGDNGTWYQELPCGTTAFDSATSRLQLGSRTLGALTDWIPANPSSSIGVGADFSGVETVFAGAWGDAEPLDPALFRGKVAVYLGGPPPAGGGGRAGASPPACDALPDRFGAAAAARADSIQRAARAGGRAGRGGGGGGGGTQDSRAVAAGAIAVVFTGLEDLPTATVRAAFARRPGMQPAATPSSSLPGAVTVRSAVAAEFFGVASLGALDVGTKGLPLTGRWRQTWQPGAVPARNVIAILPGSDPARAHEYVLLGAHNDHSGVATPVDHDSLRAVNTVTRRQGANDPVCRPTAAQQRVIDSLIAHARRIRPPRLDSILNGADDDGSGSMLMLEVAERFARERPARSIIFISHQGEEGGLRGSRWFTDHPTVPLENIVAAHNMDMVGRGRVTEVKYGGPASVQMLGARRLSREFGDIIDSVNAVREEVMAIDRSWDVPSNPMNRFCRSDQVNYVRRNVPVVYLSLGYAQDYHQVTDEPQYIDYEHSARLGRFVFDVMMAIAQRKDRPAIAGPDPSYPSC